jgi:hypothetical protein
VIAFDEFDHALEPAPLMARTLKRYVPGLRPVKAALVDDAGTVTDLLPEFVVAEYFVIGAPPLSVGTDHDTVTLPVLGVACTLVGAPDVVATTVNATVFAEADPRKLLSPGVKTALIGEYPSTANVVDVLQLVAGSVTVQRFGCPGELNTTVPVAAPGTPDCDSVATSPWLIVAEMSSLTLMLNEVPAVSAALMFGVVAPVTTVTVFAAASVALLLYHSVA